MKQVSHKIKTAVVTGMIVSIAAGIYLKKLTKLKCSSNFKKIIMKKINAAIVLFSLFLSVTPFIVRAQQAKVTVTINGLTALSTDACNREMDFYAKISIGGKIKTFPVREGNSLRDLNWQFTTTTDLGLIGTLIEIWDEDDAVCGGADDEVCVSGNLNKIRQSFSTRAYMNQGFRSVGTVKAGSERAGITYTITIEPTKTGLLTQSSWKQVKQEYKTGSGPWEELVATPINPTTTSCRTDDYFIFHRNATYERNEGATKCSPTDPLSIILGTWNFLIRETRIQITLTGYSSNPIIYSIDQLNENTLILTTVGATGDMTTYTRTTYGH